MSESGLQECVYNDFYIGEGADVTIVAGCGIHNCGVDTSKHEGIHTFYLEKNAKVKNELKKQYENFRENVKQTFIKEMNENSTVGSISELYDSKKPYLAKGAFAQAWSVSEIFKIILQKG